MWLLQKYLLALVVVVVVYAKETMALSRGKEDRFPLTAFSH